MNKKSDFPLTNTDQLSVVKHPVKEVCLKEIKQYTERGGMPGIFAIREEGNRGNLFDAWLETTCTRDLAQFEIPKFNPELAKRILFAVATLQVPSKVEIVKQVSRQPRQIEKYLDGFKSLFTIYEIEPYQTSTGKSLYYLFDSGLARHVGSNSHRTLQIWFLNECFSQFSYSGISQPDIFYYQNAKGSRLDFVIQHKSDIFAVQISKEEAPSGYALRMAEAFSQKHPHIKTLVLTPSLQAHAHRHGIKIIPWSWIV